LQKRFLCFPGHAGHRRFVKPLLHFGSIAPWTVLLNSMPPAQAKMAVIRAFAQL
jgi:hypothetical protein